MAAQCHSSILLHVICTAQPGGLFRSLYLIKKVMRVTPAAAFERHMCPNAKCGFVWTELLHRKDYDKHRHDLCPKCKHGRRFKNKRGPLEPSKRCDCSIRLRLLLSLVWQLVSCRC